MSLHVTICDDEGGRRSEWQSSLQKLLGDDAEVDSIIEFEAEWQQLLTRRAEARNRPADALPSSEDPNDWNTTFDRADVLVVDYDLFGFEEADYLTGAIVAYLARCFSRCKVILGVNQFGPNPFDLTIRTTLASFSDLSIGEAQLLNRQLWFPERHQGFRPWYWSPVTELVGSFDARCEVALGGMDSGVLEACGVHGMKEYMPRSVLGMLERYGNADEVTSFRDLASGARLGYRPNDRPPSSMSLARVAAARTAQWCEQALLPLQDVLIDLPHLVQRNAALLTDGPTPEALTRVVTVTGDVATSELIEELTQYRARTGSWLSRPAFLWPSIRSDRRLPGARNPRDVPRLDDVFCEDTSRFAPRDQAQRFVSALDSSIPTRWIEKLDDVEYRPLARLTS